MRIVFLVPWRESSERLGAFTFTMEHLATYGWNPIVLGDSDGEWNRAEALNRAAAEAGAWDIAVIADADTVHEPQILERAVQEVSNRGGAMVPWQHRHKLSAEGSARLMRSGPGRPRYADTDHADPTPMRMTAIHRGGPIVVSREAWDAVNGFDPAFRQWGHEDVAMRVSLRRLSRLREQRGTIWHLWHPRHGAPSVENEQRKQAYMDAQHDPERLRWLVSR